MDQQLTAIRLVTERYREMQGLRLVLGGVAFVSTCGAYTLAGAPWGSSGLLIALVTAFAIMTPGMLLLDRYYTQRFGSIVSSASQRATFWRPAAVAVALSVANQGLGLSPLAGALPIAGALTLWITIRDWPLRGHHLIAACTTVVATWIATMAPGGDRQVAEGLAFAVFGAGYIPVGLLDHWMLVRTLRGSFPQQDLASELPRQD